MLFDVPARQHGQEAKHRGQQDERHADAVGAEIVVDVELPDPLAAGDPIAGAHRFRFGDAGACLRRLFRAGVEIATGIMRGRFAPVRRIGVEHEQVTDEHQNAGQQGQGRSEESTPTHSVLAAAGEEHQQQCEHRRNKDDQRHQNQVVFEFHVRGTLGTSSGR